MTENVTIGGSRNVSPSRQKKSSRYNGPMKIIVVEPRSTYCERVWCAIGIGFTHVLIGAVNMAVFIYTELSRDFHATACCLGFHFFFAEAILAFHNANGCTTPMQIRHRKLTHIILNVCGIVCIFVGIVCALFVSGLKGGAHAITGIFAVILMIVGAIFGIYTYNCKKRWMSTTHISFGIATFLMSSLCLCLALASALFIKWTHKSIAYILILFVIYNTIFIITSSFMKCVSRMY